MNHAPDPSPTPGGRKIAARPPASASLLTADDTLSSTALLNGRPSVVIEHDGERYVLHATRAGKLILTK